MMKAKLFFNLSIFTLVFLFSQPQSFAQKDKKAVQSSTRPTTTINADPDDGGEVIGDPDDGGEIGRNFQFILDSTFLSVLEADAKLIFNNRKLTATQKNSPFIQSLKPALNARKMSATQFGDFIEGVAKAGGSSACKTSINKCYDACQKGKSGNKSECQVSCVQDFLSCSAKTASNFGLPIPKDTRIINGF